MRIVLTPTNRKEIVNGIEFRVFTGFAVEGNVPLEMLGLWRIGNAEQAAQFERMVCSVSPGDPQPVTLLSSHGLIKP